MGITSILHSLLACVHILLFNCISLLVLLVQEIVGLALIYGLRERSHPVLWQGCSFLSLDSVVPAKCRVHGPGEYAAECVVCLCNIEEGEEIREIRCKHLFHKACLDKWFEHRQAATCPLCRDTLIIFERTAKLADTDEVELDSSTLCLAAYACMW